MAAVFALKYMEDAAAGPASVRLVTYGQPLIGDKNLAARLDVSPLCWLARFLGWVVRCSRCSLPLCPAAAHNTTERGPRLERGSAQQHSASHTPIASASRVRAAFGRKANPRSPPAPTAPPRAQSALTAASILSPVWIASSR